MQEEFEYFVETDEAEEKKTGLIKSYRTNFSRPLKKTGWPILSR